MSDRSFRYSLQKSEWAIAVSKRATKRAIALLKRATKRVIALSKRMKEQKWAIFQIAHFSLKKKCFDSGGGGYLSLFFIIFCNHINLLILICDCSIQISSFSVSFAQFKSFFFLSKPVRLNFIYFGIGGYF